MKRFDELEHAELVALTDDQVTHLIELEIAYAGVIPEPEPTLLPVKEPDIEPTVEAYEVHGIICMSQNDAVTISKMDIRREDYNWKVSSRYKTLKKPDKYENAGVKPVKYYNSDDLEKVQAQIKDAERNKGINSDRQSAYRKYRESISEIETKVWDKIRDAKDFEADLARAREVLQKHQNLAEGNEAIAQKFFTDAYKDRPEIIKVILPDYDMPAEGDATDGKAE